MKKKSIIIGIAIVVIAFGCYQVFSQKKDPITFDGQGNKWRAEVVTKSESIGKEKVTTTFKYLGKDKKSIDNFEFEINSSARAWGMGVRDLENQKTFSNTETVNTFRKMKSDDLLNVTVKSNGKTDTFSLTHK